MKITIVCYATSEIKLHLRRRRVLHGKTKIMMCAGGREFMRLKYSRLKIECWRAGLDETSRYTENFPIKRKKKSDEGSVNGSGWIMGEVTAMYFDREYVSCGVR